MSKKKNRKKASPTPLAPVQPQVAGAASFGYDEMLSELEAIVAEGADGIIHSARRQDLFSPACAAPASVPYSPQNSTSRGNNAPADQSC